MIPVCNVVVMTGVLHVRYETMKSDDLQIERHLPSQDRGPQTGTRADDVVDEVTTTEPGTPMPNMTPGAQSTPSAKPATSVTSRLQRWRPRQILSVPLVLALLLVGTMLVAWLLAIG